MTASQDYLAKLGFDTTDVDKAVGQTVTLLGHLAAAFPEVSKNAERAETALDRETAALKRNAQATSAATTATRGWAQSRASIYKAGFQSSGADKTDLEKRSQQTAIYNQYLYDQARAAEQVNGNLARLRYAVYDVSNALGIGGLAALAFTTAIVGSAVAYEREFANVRRTVGVTGDEADRLYQKFLRLSTDIPVSFGELTKIGTLAGQLNVPEARIASFTETVAQFAATTDVSVDASATAFGRLDQLIDGVDGRYRNLGSSILNVGINSVATESQIIAISSQIAATGNQAGLTADEIIGLSASLASLGIAPEAARGTILRVFSQINSAVSAGGERLNDFAQISGLTADQFREKWGTDFTSAFLSFLGGVDAQGAGAESSLRALGITATRDVNAMLKLSQNTESVANNLQLAAVGFQNGNMLAENFGIIAETNAAKLQVLIQTVQAFAASLGAASSGPLSFFLGYLQRLLDALLEFSQTPVGQGLSLLTTVLGGTVGVMLILLAVAGRGVGTFLALKTAIGETYIQTMLAQGGMRGFTATLLGAAGAANAFGAALKATGVGLLITTGLFLIGEVIGRIGEAMQSGEERAIAYFGSLDGLSDAIKADNAGLFADQVERINATISDSTDESGSWVDALRAAAEIQAELKGATDDAGNAIDQQTLRIGENTQQWLRNALASSSAFQEIFKNLQGLDALTGSNTFTDSASGASVQFQAFDLEEYVRLASTEGTVAATAFFDSWQAGLGEAFAATGETVLLENVIPPETYQAVEQAGVEIANAVQAGMSEAASADAANALLDAVLGPLEDGAGEAGDVFKTLMADIYDTVNAEAELSASTQKLGEDFASNGSQIASSGQAMQAVISAIYDSSNGNEEAAARMQGFFNALIAGGYASAQQLSGLQAVIASLAGGKTVAAVPFDMSAFTKGVTTAGRAAGGAARQVRTLVDYASDLAKVMDRSFEIRFGGTQALDSITSGWQSIRDAIADTNEQIADYQAKMQQLSADKAVREYWLSVAENYGDTLRAGLLRAEIAELDADLASTSRDLTDAQAKNSKTLVGNSKAAIQNRAEILDLVSGYQDYIEALAASGVPQSQLRAKAAQLKADFIAQATQLGYNVNELGIYSRAFDDVSLAIGRVPRNITVAANTNPALQALSELEAKARSLGGQSFPGPKITNPTIASEVRRMALEAAIRSRAAWVNLLINERNFSGAEKASLGLDVMRKQLLTGSYRSGTAWTGSGSPWEVAGVVHNREAVLNQRATSMIPPSWINAWNQGRNPVVMAPSAAPGGLGQSGPIDLSPYTLRRLEEIMGMLSVVIGDAQIGAATDRYHESVRATGG
jgi:TP901 family phage tail tape measure protein